MTQNHQGDTLKSILLLSIAAVASAAPLQSQATAGGADSICTKYSGGRMECRAMRRLPGDSGLHTVVFRMDSAMAKRAALGIELRSTGTLRDTLGVFVEGVAPKGPAETAGIVEGDRLAAINGVDLRTPAADIEDSYSNGLASHRLTREVRKLSPGSRVTLRVYSGGRFRDVQVTAGKASDLMGFGGQFKMGFPGPEGMEFYRPGAGMMELDGPGGMIAPEARILRERIEPLLRGHIEEMRSQPRRIQLRNPVRTLLPARGVMRVERTSGDELEVVTAAEIRDLAAAAVRDARSALKQLAADGLV
jgi:PDZ domain